MLKLADADVIVALGANLDEPVQQLRQALQEIAQLDGCELVAQSSLYGSTPVGPEQPDYVNAVAHLRSDFTPAALLYQLQTIESAHHRERKQRWGARTLDLDIILFGQQRINEARLTIPHAHMHERVFVLQPLAQLYPDLLLPHLGVNVSEQLSTLVNTGIWPLFESSI